MDKFVGYHSQSSCKEVKLNTDAIGHAHRHNSEPASNEQSRWHQIQVKGHAFSEAQVAYDTLSLSLSLIRMSIRTKGTHRPLSSFILLYYLCTYYGCHRFRFNLHICSLFSLIRVRSSLTPMAAFFNSDSFLSSKIFIRTYFFWVLAVDTSSLLGFLTMT